MFRVLKRRPSVSDYGASWATIMLAPVAGALAGWAGVAVLGVLAELDVLDERFLRAWETPRSVLVLGLAAALGASEPFFDRLVSLAEGGQAGRDRRTGDDGRGGHGSRPGPAVTADLR